MTQQSVTRQMLETPTPEVPSHVARRMDPASEFMARLQAIPDQEVTLMTLRVAYPANVPTATPTDMTWMIWWTHVVGPMPTMTVGYLHHLAKDGATTVNLNDVAQWLTPPDGPVENELYPLTRLHWGITRASLHRLVGLASHRTSFKDGVDPTVLVLPVLIPRPGPDGWAAIGETIDRGTGADRG